MKHVHQTAADWTAACAAACVPWRNNRRWGKTSPTFLASAWLVDNAEDFASAQSTRSSARLMLEIAKALGINRKRALPALADTGRTQLRLDVDIYVMSTVRGWIATLFTPAHGALVRADGHDTRTECLEHFARLCGRAEYDPLFAPEAP